MAAQHTKGPHAQIIASERYTEGEIKEKAKYIRTIVEVVPITVVVSGMRYSQYIFFV